jgi:hypothetical protein
MAWATFTYTILGDHFHKNLVTLTLSVASRTWVAGVTAGEFALAHFLVSLVVNLLQVVITLVFMILVFQVSRKFVKYYLTGHDVVVTMFRQLCQFSAKKILFSQKQMLRSNFSKN